MKVRTGWLIAGSAWCFIMATLSFILKGPSIDIYNVGAIILMSMSIAFRRD